MSNPNLPAPRPTPEQRERAMDLLSRYFAAGRIELEDMERRMEIAARADTEETLAGALVGLAHPAREESAASPAPMGQDRPKGKARSFAILSGTIRRGRWFPARHHTGVAFMGGMRLDFRDAELEPGTTEIDLWVMWGGVEIIVPPDLDVEVDGVAIMAGIKEVAQHPGPLEGVTRRLRVRARVLMGGVDVRVRPPRGAPAESDDRLPRRRGRRRLR